MSFRSRLVIASSLVAVVTLGGAFAAVALMVGSSQAKQLDRALIAEAKEEATEAATLGGRELAIIEETGPNASDLGPLARYAVIYGGDGEVHDSTSTFRCGLPSLESVRHPLGLPFEFHCGREHLRGVLVALPAHPGSTLLLATSLADLEHEAKQLRGAMFIALVLASGWSILVTRWVVRSLTREHQAIAAVSRRVAAGDLTARVEIQTSDRDIGQLAGDINDMIGRLALLVQTQRRFIANAAHELRSPLTTLYGELSHALRKQRSTEDYRGAIEEALDATRRLKFLANDLLALARLGAELDAETEAALVDLEVMRVVEAGVAEATALAEEHGVTVTVIGWTDAWVHGRKSDLERLVRNLVDNAIQHSPRGATVSVAANAANAAGDAIDIAIEDAGPGVPAEDRERIFEPFFRGARDRADTSDGAGLGLSIARDIARSHGGEVRFEPVTSGARFVVRLPMVAQPASARG